MLRWLDMDDRDARCRSAYRLFLLIYGFLILVTFQDYGVTSDEANHLGYGRDILRWYTSVFSDDRLFATKDTWLYGGCFDLLATLVGSLLPLDSFDARHLCTAAVGVLGVIGAHRIGNHLGGPLTGLLAALFLCLTPRFYGHAFNNPKDIPFAVAYLWSVWCLIRVTEAWPQPPRRLIWQTGLWMGFALGIRIGGVILLGTLLLFALLKMMRTRQVDGPFAAKVLLRVVAISAIAYGVMVLFWPWAQIHPIAGPWQAIRTFSSFPDVHYTLFEGRYVGSDETPWHYAPKWLLLSLPEFVLLGLATGAILWIRRSRFDASIAVLVFTGLFPVCYASVTGMALYDGIRHLRFAVPPLVVTSAIAWGQLSSQLAISRHKRLLWIGLCFLVGLTFWEMLRLHPNEYVYFNLGVAGGVDRAAARYDTDYWHNSCKEGLEYLELNSSSRPAKRGIRITSLNPCTADMADPDVFEWSEFSDDVEFYLSTTRFDQHRILPGEVVHTVHAGATPLLYIIRPDSAYRDAPFFADAPFKFFYVGTLYSNAQSHEQAISAYQSALRLGVSEMLTPKRLETLYVDLAALLVKEGRMDDAEKTLQEALSYDSDFARVWLVLGRIHRTAGSEETALGAFERAVELRPYAVDYHLEYAGMLVRCGLRGRAIEAYHGVLELDAGNPEARRALRGLGIKEVDP